MAAPDPNMSTPACGSPGSGLPLPTIGAGLADCIAWAAGAGAWGISGGVRSPNTSMFAYGSPGRGCPDPKGTIGTGGATGMAAGTGACIITIAGACIAVATGAAATGAGGGGGALPGTITSTVSGSNLATARPPVISDTVNVDESPTTLGATDADSGRCWTAADATGAAVAGPAVSGLGAPGRSTGGAPIGGTSGIGATPAGLAPAGAGGGGTAGPA